MDRQPRKKRKDTNVMVRVTTERKARWRKAGEARGESLSEFVTKAADLAVGRKPLRKVVGP